MPTDIQALRRVAEAAVKAEHSHAKRMDETNMWPFKSHETRAWNVFHAEWTPGRVLELLDDRDRLARRVERAERLQQQLAARTAEVETLREELRARS